MATSKGRKVQRNKQPKSYNRPKKAPVKSANRDLLKAQQGWKSAGTKAVAAARKALKN
jgi:hypothetical protein